MLDAVALSTAIASCAPAGSDRALLQKIIMHESGGNEFAVDDNTTRRSYFPKDRASAQALLVQLRGDNIDAGLTQLNERNWPALGVTEANVFDRCTNIQGGARVFAYFYNLAIREGLAGYNTGDIYSAVGARYADLVLDRTTEFPQAPRGVGHAPAARLKPPSSDEAPSPSSGPLAPPSRLGAEQSSSF